MRVISLRFRAYTAFAFVVVILCTMLGYIAFTELYQSPKRHIAKPIDALIEMLVVSTDVDGDTPGFDISVAKRLQSMPYYWRVESGGNILAESSLLLLPKTVEAIKKGNELSLHRVGSTQAYIRQDVIRYDESITLTYTVGMPEVIANAILKQERRERLLSIAPALIISLLLVLSVLYINLHRILQPLAKVERGLDGIQSGQSKELEGHYPLEFQKLADLINNLLRYQYLLIDKYRKSLSNLSHAIKTPLSVLRNNISQHTPQSSTTSLQHIDDINALLDRQLSRVRSIASSSHTMQHIDVADIIARSAKQLSRLYNVTCDVESNVNQFLVFGHGEDFYELFGNLIDNACKYGREYARISLDEDDKFYIITIEDDGNGVPSEQMTDLAVYGKRLDERQEGHGVGLAIAMDILTMYSGTCEFSNSSLGGLKLTIQFSKHH